MIRDTEKTLKDSYLYRTIKRAALLGLLGLIAKTLKENSGDYLLQQGYIGVIGMERVLGWLFGDDEQSYTMAYPAEHELD